VLIAFCGIFGLAVGSFLNVVIYRVPRHESVVTPRSACPSCGKPISAADNVPVISWVLLRGRCRNCNTAISTRYPLIEVLAASLFAGAAARTGFAWDLPAYLVLCAALLALACIDLEHLLLPKALVYSALGLFTALLALAAGISGHWHDLVIGTACAAGWFVVFFLLNALSPRLLGFGDVRLAPLLGLSLGWLGVRYVLLGFFSANLIGALVGIALILTKRISRQQQVPYGVFLAVGAAFAFFAGPEVLRPLAHFR
jgi:leader peptidase (prepilin peptidase) / N-methyltransferase